MKSLLLNMGCVALVAAALNFSACSGDDEDPGGNNPTDGSVAATCVSSLSGTGTLNINSNTSTANLVVIGTCSGQSFAAGISSSAGAIVIQFKGLPNPGTFLIRNPLDYGASTANNVVFVAVGDSDGATNDYLSTSTGTTRVTVEKVGNSIRVILPRITVTQVVGGASIPVEANFTIAY